MSTKRKKNSRNPARNITFLKIYEDKENPWPSNYYMCGMCGHAISEKEVTHHAQKTHKAQSLTLCEVDDTQA